MTGMDDDAKPPDEGRMPEPRELTPFERFEELTRRLVGVPKSAVEAERSRQRGAPRTN